MSLKIYDVAGRELSKFQLTLDKGIYEIPLWVRLLSGIYFAKIETKNTFETVKFFVINRR